MQYLPSWDEVKEFQKIPCMRDSLMRGIGGGLAIGLIWSLGARNPKRMGDGLFLGAAAVASGSWLMCRRNDRVRREAVHRMMLAQSKAVDSDEVLREASAEAAAAQEAVKKQ